MSDTTALATEVHDIVEPGQSALIEGAGITADALDVLTELLGQAQASQAAFQAAVLAQIAAQHTEMLAAIAVLVVRQSGL